ncbi:hypothetical protein D3C85_577830 [compost metagenome]
MAIKRGGNTISRTHAKNFTQEAAQKRLDETVPAFNQQVMNSLFVDSVEIEYYHIQTKVGIPCTCEKTAVEPVMLDEQDSNIAPVIPTKDSTTKGAKVRFQETDIFGESLAEKIYNDDMDARVIDVSGDGNHIFHEIEEPGIGDAAYADGFLGGGGIDCGICYRTGFQPPYKAYGKQRYLFTNYDIEQSDGFRVNTHNAPHTIEKHDRNAPGYVMFKTMVPKYFTTMTVSVRDNLVYLVEDHVLRTDGERMTTADFRDKAGREVQFLVQAACFTHVVIEFELDIPKLRANISGEQAALDYERLTTISDITVVLPPTLSEVEPGDILILKKRNLALKVRDKDRKITADKRRLEWSVSTRVLQPTEALRNIANGFKLY